MKRDASQKAIQPPMVEVRIPKITLRFDDITYLRSLDMAQHCAHSSGRIEKLRLMKLIEDKIVPRPDTELKKLATEKQQLLNVLHEATIVEDWDSARNLVYQLQNNQRAATPRSQIVITDMGRKLLSEGNIQVRIMKVGCA